MERKNKRTKPTPSLPNENNRGRTGKVSLLELLEMEDGMCLKYPSMLSKGFYPVERDHGLKSCQISNHSLASYLASDASRRFVDDAYSFRTRYDHVLSCDLKVWVS